MKTKYVILLFIALSCFRAISQKVDMDRKLLAVNYTSFPEESELKDYYTYSLKITAPKNLLAIRDLNFTALYNKLNLNGFTKVKQDPDFKIHIQMYHYGVVTNSIESETRKDAKGNATKLYFQRVKYYVTIAADIREKYGDPISRFVIANYRNVKVWESERNASYDKAKANSSNVNNGYQKAIINYINKLFEEIPKIINDQYGFGKTTAWVSLYELDSKNHPEYLAYKMAYDTLKLVFKSFEPGCNIEDLTARAAVPIKYLEELVPKLSATDKQQKKLLEKTLINLMQIHFFTNNFAKFDEYGDKLMNMNEDEDNDEFRVLELERIEKRMRNAVCKSLYYVKPTKGEFVSKFGKTKNNSNVSESISGDSIGVMDASMEASMDTTLTLENKSETTPTETTTAENVAKDNVKNQNPVVIKDFDINALKANPSDIVSEGSLTDKKAQVLKGYFIINASDQEHLRFNGRLSNIKFFHIVDNNAVKVETDPSNFDVLDFNGRIFKTLIYKDPFDPRSREEASIMESLSDNSKVQVYHYMPSRYMQKNESSPWYVVSKISDKKISVSKNDPQWKTKLQEIFGDCEVVMTEINNANVSNLSDALLIGWCEKYESCLK